MVCKIDLRWNKACMYFDSSIVTHEIDCLKEKDLKFKNSISIRLLLIYK